MVLDRISWCEKHCIALSGQYRSPRIFIPNMDGVFLTSMKYRFWTHEDCLEIDERF